MNGSEILGLFPPFADPNRAWWRSTLPDVEVSMLPAGQVAFADGSLCHGVAFVGSGRIRVSKFGLDGRQISLYHVGPGETCLLTLNCALTGEAYTATGVVDDPVEAVMVPVGVFRNWFDRHEVFRNYVIGTITGRVVELMELVQDVAFSHASSRVARFLVTTSAEAHQPTIEMTHDDIAAELGNSRETVSRILKELERKKILTLARGSIRILDADALCREST